MANYDSNYNPSADPRLDDAPFTGEEVAEDHTAGVTLPSGESLGKIVMLRKPNRTNVHRNVGNTLSIPR
jgi:hypothetical protein